MECKDFTEDRSESKDNDKRRGESGVDDEKREEGVVTGDGDDVEQRTEDKKDKVLIFNNGKDHVEFDGWERKVSGMDFLGTEENKEEEERHGIEDNVIMGLEIEV